MVTGSFNQNGYLIWNKTKDTIIIDPGSEFEKFSRYIDENYLNPMAILNTHAHIDHIGAISEIKKKYSCHFYLNKNDIELLENANYYSKFFNYSNIEIPIVDYFLKDNQVLKFRSITIKVIETPGHTRGGVCFLVANNLFTGDTLFKGNVGRTDLPGGDEKQLQKSIRKIMLLNDKVQIYPGHGEKTSIAYERLNNPYIT